ncbi:hypothetical protein [Bordetella sp. FB-8]|uniref:hypothetical protein n=1 Tax=Bordetella sp. FB-8 TaxID=1159870 RepID=UPI0012DC1FD5|nr:hypothetical protein [Bordetella sp. FB-8]
MSYFLWSLPALAVIAAIGSGRLNTIRAAILGLLIAVPVAMLAGPAAFGGARRRRCGGHRRCGSGGGRSAAHRPSPPTRISPERNWACTPWCRSPC